jgi:hypothetical protein
MLTEALVLASTLTIPHVPSPEAAQGPSTWQRTDSPRFEIHYLPAVAGDLEPITRIAERAYDRISRRLNFTLATKVPLVMFAPSGPLTRQQVLSHAVSDAVAPQHPHRSRIVLPLGQGESELETLMVHELTHLLFAEIIVPQAPGDGGVPRWVHEGIASYIAGAWPGDHERLMRELVASNSVPALSQLSGGGGFANARLNEALGHAVFDYIESRWGAASIRRFIDALIVPRVDKTYDAVFDLTPSEFDRAFRLYASRRFGAVAR